MSHAPTCSFCDKQGLLILPVRYAVAPITAELPAVSFPLQVADVSVGPSKPQDLALQGSAQYTTRLLRSGYLYMYNEVNDRMTAHWITQDGYLMPLPFGTLVSHDAKTATPCHHAGHKELAGCIAVADTQNVGIVWFGFSDVQWTPAVINAHRGGAGKALRERHMRAFDVSAWLRAHSTSPSQPLPSERGRTPHALPLTALAETVAEYAPMPESNKRLHLFRPPSAPNLHQRADQARALLTACRRRSPAVTPVIIALDDPAGIAQDLAALIQWQQDRVLDKPVFPGTYVKHVGDKGYITTYRALVALDANIHTLRMASDEQVKQRMFQDAERTGKKLQQQFDEGPGLPFLAGPPAPGVQDVIAAVEHPSLQAIQEAQVSAWHDYQARTVIGQTDGPYQQWHKDFDAAMASLQTQHLQPLAAAHATWMQSNLLANQLEATHDGDDPYSGEAYVETLQRCMAGTQQFPVCASVYERWLKMPLTDQANLLLRALVLKQESLIQALATAPLEASQVPWQALRDQYAAHLEPLLQPSVSAIALAAMAKSEAATAWQRYERAQRANVPTSALVPDDFVADLAEATWKESQAKAEAAEREAKAKLLPDAVASLLVQVGGPLTTVLREAGRNVAEKTLMRWVVMLGVTLGKPAGVLQVRGSARETREFLARTFVDNLVIASAKQGKALSGAQSRQLEQYARRQAWASFATGNIGSFEARLGNSVTAKLTVFLPDSQHKELARLSDPTKQIAFLAENVVSPKTLHEYGVMRVNAGASVLGSASEGVLALIDGITNGAAWKTMLDEEAKALSFQKTRTQDVRETLGLMQFVGSVAGGGAQVIKLYGTWRSHLAMGMVMAKGSGRLVETADKALRWTGAFGGLVSAVLAGVDLADGATDLAQKQLALGALEIVSGAVGITGGVFAIWAVLAEQGGATMAAGMTLSIWIFILAVIGVVIADYVDKIKGDKIAQWLERCYWGNHPSYEDPERERKDFDRLMMEA